VVAQTEARADGLGGQPLHEEGVQRGEAAVQGLRRFEEEAAAGCIVHDGLRSEGEFQAAGQAAG
jgi:hypothetical protein